jgi:hypothetical protein
VFFYPKLYYVIQTWFKKEGRKKGTFDEYRGYSVIKPYVYENEKGEKVEKTMRFLVVESTSLTKKKGKKIDDKVELFLYSVLSESSVSSHTIKFL